MKKFLYFFGVTILIGLLYVAFLHYQIIKYANMEPPKDAEYLIVLGAKVNGTVMSLSLQERADVALTYLNENPNTIVVVTGGQGEDELITEASALEDFFLNNGITKERILVEDTSTSTYENFKNTYELYNITEAVVVTNTFHSYRANFLAQQVGMKTYPLNARTPLIIKPKSYVREYLAITKAYVFKK